MSDDYGRDKDLHGIPSYFPKNFVLQNIPISVECKRCKENNLFRIGFVLEDLYEFDDGFKIYDTDTSSIGCPEVPLLIQSKMISLFPSVDVFNYTADIDGAHEHTTLPTIRSKFTLKTYFETFIPLIEAEANREREIKEAMKQENVTLRCYDGYEMRLDLLEESIRLQDMMKYAVEKMTWYEKRSEISKVVDSSGECMNNGKKKSTGIMHTVLTGDIIQRKIAKNQSIPSNIDGNTILTPPGFPKLNTSQLVAIEAALSSTNLTLVQGPPGTGKTLVSSAIVYNFVKAQKRKVFIIAPSNTAVDQLAIKINNTGLKVLRVVSKRKEEEASEVDYLSMHVLVNELVSEEVKNKYGNKHGNVPDSYTAVAQEELIKSADVICCTCVTAGQKLFNKHNFPIVLIDEAVQCTEPLTLIPCMYNCEKLILVGDHKQLGPTVLNKEAIKSGFKQSLFERMLSLNVMAYLLSIQYRMNSSLCEFPNEYFYNGYLRTASKDVENMDKDNSMTYDNSNVMSFNSSSIPDKLTNLNSINFFYATYCKEEISQNGTSYINKGEGVIVENIIKYLFRNGVMEQQIGVITPYEGQRSYILNKMVETGNLEISNVDGFQGREKDYIIVSLVRSNSFQGIGFVADKRRMNVTLTRAKYGLIVIGNPFTLYKNRFWGDFLEFYSKKGQIYEGNISNLRGVSLKEIINEETE
ncbi:unnamed protein product, partial [Medioppia subpectinata]